MHKLNFCKDLCLPVEGIKGSRGLEILAESESGVVIPMMGAATPNHGLYVSKPIRFSADFPKGRIVHPHEIDTVGKIYALINKNLVIAPDSALDPSHRADVVFEGRDDDLKALAEHAFQKGHERFVIWANNGIGQDASFPRGEGVWRDARGIAYGTMLGGQEKQCYQRGISNAYQNSAHQHTHVAPTTRENGYDRLLEGTLASIHQEKPTRATLNEFRDVVAQKGGLGVFPVFSVAVLDSKEGIPDRLEFNHYAGPQSMAGLARTLAVEHSALVRGMDFKDKAIKGAAIDGARKFYSGAF